MNEEILNYLIECVILKSYLNHFFQGWISSECNKHSFDE